jgi:hypothetical protein
MAPGMHALRAGVTPMPTRSSRSGPPAGLRRVAVLTAFAFGCATVRVPASTIPDSSPVHGSFAEPQVELWLESGRNVSPAESAEASAQAKAALQSALSRVSAPQGDAILAVRAQGVARTSSRKTDQRAATAGIVVGAVVVVAAVVVALVASKGKGGGGSAARVASAAKPVPRVRPAPPPGALLPRAVPRSGGSVSVNVFAGIDVPPPDAPPGQYVYVDPPPVWGEPVSPPPPPPPPGGEITAVSLRPPPPLDLEQRGFFDGDTVRLELVVVDRHSGAPLWTKTVDGEIDPRDAAAVEQLLYDAVADQTGWAPAVAAPAPPADLR